MRRSRNARSSSTSCPGRTADVATAERHRVQGDGDLRARRWTRRRRRSAPDRRWTRRATSRSHVWAGVDPRSSSQYGAPVPAPDLTPGVELPAYAHRLPPTRERGPVRGRDRTPHALRCGRTSRAMPRSAWVLFAGAFVNRLGTFVLPFITLYLTSRGYSAPQAGLGLAAYGVGAIAAQGVGGLLADRLGRRNAIALSSMIGGAVLHALARLGERALGDRRRRRAARDSWPSSTGRRRARSSPTWWPRRRAWRRSAPTGCRSTWGGRWGWRWAASSPQHSFDWLFVGDAIVLAGLRGRGAGLAAARDADDAVTRSACAGTRRRARPSSTTGRSCSSSPRCSSPPPSTCRTSARSPSSSRSRSRGSTSPRPPTATCRR